LFTKLDAGVKLLKEIQKQLKRYRQSVLKSAFEGNLTAEWREKYRHAERSRHFSSGESKHVTRMAAEALEDYSTSAHPSTPPIEDIGVAQGDNLTYEPASVLLERIKKERKEKLDKSSRGGSAFGGKYRARTERSRSELPPIDTSELPELPEGWVWARTGEVVENVQSVNPKIDLEKEFTYLDIASIDNTIQRITEPKVYYGNNAPSRARQLVKTGDILFSTVRTYLKNFAVVDEKYDGQIASTGFCVIRPHQSIDKKYVFYYIQTNEFLNPLTQIQRGTSYPAVRDSDVFEQKIPLTPYLEQLQIVSEIERCFSVADEVEKIVEQSLVQAERLRHSILKKAFEGKLVPQDPTDPPASVLLEQIKLEKEKKIERIKKEKDKTAKNTGKRKCMI
ncbi:MAG: restriction endonuclease subunit S, partial [Bacteroidetes bacterium]|nr:restriction endonuclease subunit S [Bacteroidota bacterium]